MKKLRSTAIAIMAMALMLMGGSASASAAEFHNDQGEGAELLRLDVLRDVTFDLSGATVTCGIMSNLGVTTGSSMSSVELNIVLHECTGEYIPDPESWDTRSCILEYHASGTVDLKSCASGGIIFDFHLPYGFLDCKVVIPNQTGITGITYTNVLYEDEFDAVRFDHNLSLAASAPVSRGFCPVAGTFEVTFDAVSEVSAWPGLTIG